MPKKRSIVRGFNKRLQRLYQRAAGGPALPEPEAEQAPPEPAHAAAGVPKDHIEMQRIIAAQKKRLRKAARRRPPDPAL